MVTKDVSRSLAPVHKHYVGVRLQQGRVLLDSDFNEGVDLARDDQRRVLVDVIGPAGSPDRGFSIRRPLGLAPDASDKLLPGIDAPAVLFGAHTNEAARLVHPVALRAGSQYAGGLRFDLEDAESLLYQRDYLQLRPSNLPTIAASEAVSYLYYLRGHEQPVSALEDRETREALLAGADTSVRLRRTRRVEALRHTGSPGPANCDEAWAQLRSTLETNEFGTFDEKSFELRSNGRLQITFVAGDAEDACAPADPFGQRYLGAENQTLRVLLTQPDRFVWTLDTPRLFRARVTGLDQAAPSEVRVELLDFPDNERDWPFVNRVVEIIPFGALLDGSDAPGAPDPHSRKVAAEVGVFTRALQTFDPNVGSFAIDQGDPATKPILAELKGLVSRWPNEHPFAAQLNPSANDTKRYFYVRLWQQAPTRAEIELPTATPPVLGTSGIKPVFSPGRRGDYWIAALRPEAPREVIPFELLQSGGAPPSGPQRFFAPLAFVKFNGDTVTLADDCRPRIRPLNNRLCTTYIVGDGIHSFGDYLRISDAIDALPPSGGVISVRPGVYVESLLITRNDITIEGCGAATILRSPSIEATALVLSGCARVRLRQFAIQTSAIAIRADSVTDVSLQGLEISAGDFGGIRGAFRVGRGESNFALVSFSSALRLSLRDLKISPNRQAGIAIQGNQITIERLKATGSQRAASSREAPPMLEFSGSQGVTVRDASFLVFTQTAVSIVARIDRQLISKQLDFSGLDIDADEVPGTSGPGTGAGILTPFDLDDVASSATTLSSSRIRLRRGVSPAAAVSVRGSRVTVERNEISVDASNGGALAWGGIHVRGGSNGVLVRHNRVTGGAGHGVTLGSISWSPKMYQPGLGMLSSTGGGPTVITGAVFVIAFSDHGGVAVFSDPHDDGPVTNSTISDNRIEGFSTNGIGSPSVLGLHPPGPPGRNILLEVAGVRIENNLIRDNVRRPNPSILTDRTTFPFPTSRRAGILPVPLLPLGGIVLTSARNVQIVGNTIVDNAQTPEAVDVPMNGIFILTGDSIAIEANRITNNGQKLKTTDPPLRVGVRAGIAVMLAGTSTQQNSSGAIDTFLFQPVTDLDNHGLAVRVVNNTVQHPEGRALHVVAVGPVSIDGNFLSSQGNHGSADLAEQFAIGDVVYVQDLGAPWESFQFEKVIDIPKSSSEYAIELTPHLSPIMLNEVAASPRWYIGLGGSILFVNNQVVYDFTVIRNPSGGAPLSFFPNVLIGLDHTTVIGNQFAVRLVGGANLPLPVPGADTATPFFADVLVAGVTTNVELNRFSETIGSTLLSLISNGDVFNITTLNQSTHRIAPMVTLRARSVPADPKVLINTDNLVLVRPLTGTPSVMDDDSLIQFVKSPFQEFLKLAFRPPR